MARLNEFLSLLDRTEEQLVVNGERLKHDLNQWIDERVALARVELREVKARFGGGNSAVNGPQIVAASGRQLTEQRANPSHGEVISVNRNKPSTSAGDKTKSRNVNKRTNQAHQVSIKQKIVEPYVPPLRAERLTRTRPWYRETVQEDDQKGEDYQVDRNRRSTSSAQKRKATANKSQANKKRPKTRPPDGSNVGPKCKFAGCNKTFRFDSDMARHERIHLGIKPFYCTWPPCEYASPQCTAVVTHVRIAHFELPQTVKKQKELNIVDDRDPRQFVRVDQQLANRRL